MVRLLSMIGNWFKARSDSRPKSLVEHPCTTSAVVDIGGNRHDLAAGAHWHEGLPHPDWEQVEIWLDSLPDDLRAEAWLACERTWLCWLGSHFDNYRVYESSLALLLAAQNTRRAELATQFIATTAKRVQRLLEELAQPGELGKEIVIATSDPDTYHRYLARFQSDDQAVTSSGVFLDEGCAHYLICGDSPQLIEPVIVHEMTHGFLAYLPLPLWLNEGMAVSTEERLAVQGPDGSQARKMLERHRRHWSPGRIQFFWSGQSYAIDGEERELAYDLGRILVQAMAADWPAFKCFVSAAHHADAGADAAAEHLNLDLGECVRAILGVGEGEWAPAPKSWT